MNRSASRSTKAAEGKQLQLPAQMGNPARVEQQRRPSARRRVRDAPRRRAAVHDPRPHRSRVTPPAGAVKEQQSTGTTMTIPALQQPIALTHRPATARNAQFGAAPPGIAGERSAVPNGGSSRAACRPRRPSVTAPGEVVDSDFGRHGEHPGASMSVAWMPIGTACQRPAFTMSDVRRSQRTTRNPSIKSRDAQDPVPILVTGQYAVRLRTPSATTSLPSCARHWSPPICRCG